MLENIGKMFRKILRNFMGEIMKTKWSFKKIWRKVLKKIGLNI